MSYSVCYHCHKMVPYYDKYCPDCRKRFKLPNLPEFQKGKTYPDDAEREAQFISDQGAAQ